MAMDPSFREHVADLLAPLGPVQIKPMFGGGGVYLHGAMFGLIVDDRLYFKVDDQTQAHFEAVGSQPFVFQMKDGKSASMRYWHLPDQAQDDAVEALVWARLGLDAAARAGQKKAGKPIKAPKLLIDGPWDED
jgi:DNA transformation protein